jgi:hypothetical protein
VLAVGSAILTVISTAVNFGSSMGIWSIIGHHQLLCLIPILQITFPVKINNFVTGFEYFMFSQNFLFFEDSFEISKDFIDVDKAQENWYLHDIGVEFESTLINVNTILKVLLLLVLVNLVYMLAYKTCIKKRITEESKMKKVHDYFISLFHYNIYLRVYMSVFMTLVLSLCFELNEFNTSTSSLFITIVLGVLVIVSLILFIIHWLKSNFVDEEQHPKKAKELYKDMKPSKIAAAYTIFELIRIVLLSCIIAFGHHIGSEASTSLFIIVTSLFFVYFVVFRPFTGAKENILQA